MNLRLDHLLYGAPELENGRNALRALTGAETVLGGRHPDQGTHNALVASGGDTYVEVIAPDPDGDGSTGHRLAALAVPQLVWWAARTDDHAALGERLAELGLPDLVIPMSRDTPDGDTLRWTIVPLTGHGLGSLVPFAIDWGTTPHPSTTVPAGPELVAFRVETPRAAELSDYAEAIGLDVAIVAADVDLLVATFSVDGASLEVSGAPYDLGFS